MFDIETELKKLPEKSGVYIMKDINDNIIYVGKAISLKRRVKQYFRKNNKTKRIENMVSLVDHFEYIVTDNEAEALILECNLIKENRPKFNVLLKDDKMYPYIRIDIKSDYPSVYITRNLQKDGARYFGPYANPRAAREMLNFIKEKFKIRQCKNFKSKDRACLNYHIGRCLAPCMKYVSKEEYKKQIEQIVMLLEGKTGVILKEIEKDMIEASKKLDYEKAAELRDRKLAIERVNEKQKVSNISENNIDVIGVYKNDISVCIEIFFVRSSRMIDRQHYFLGELKDMEISEIISGFIKQYYIEKPDIPNRIMIQENIEDKESIEKWLESKIKRKVEIKTPQKGEKQRFVEMAIRNAKITLENKSKDKMEILTELKSVLSLDKLPRKIETFDISNISGEYIVAGMCVAEDGIIKRNLSRRFKIKTVIGQDDPKCTEEVVTRRLKHSLENPKGGFGKLPDLILADGGITQIRAIKRALKKYDLQEKILVFGMVKDDTHSTRALINENRKEYEISENLFLFITNFQNEVHNTAIEYHRKLREKDINKSELDSINGIGQKKKELLLKEFKTIDNIREADVNDLLKVKGITFDLAKKIKDKIN
ncbi:MAG: excinuclease ABC subunit UvrC [Clostridia bacterium]|nr:excinuclease ABC subunit UvrC [Clostridia bacterium]